MRGIPLEMLNLAPTLSDTYPAIPGSLAVARRAVIAIAGEAGATGEQIDEIRLALSEALTNAILHAYADDDPGNVYVTTAVAGGELWVLVADDGGGLRPRSDRSGLGLGLALIAHASDELTIVKRSGGGTELRMRFRLGAGSASGAAANSGGAANSGSCGASGSAADQSRGSVASATSPASSVFSTTT